MVGTMSTAQSMWPRHPATLWVARAGLGGAALAVVVAWWVALRHGFGLLVGASAVAAAGFVVAVIGYRLRRIGAIVAGLVVVAVAAPTGFAYLGNLVALVGAAVLTVLAVRGRPSRTRRSAGSGAASR